MGKEYSKIKVDLVIKLCFNNMFEKPQHSRQAFGEAETELRLIEEERKRKKGIGRVIFELGLALKDMTGGKGEEAVRSRLYELGKQAGAEAQELNQKYELLKGKVVEAKSNLERSLRDLADFEKDELGIKEEKAA